MSDKQKTAQADSCAPCEGMSFAAMMKQMMGQQGCECLEMMSQMMGQQDVDCDCASMMSMCRGAQEEESTLKTTQEA